MGTVIKRPQVIHDLIEIATYIAENNLDASDRFLRAADETFQQLGRMPYKGKPIQLINPELVDIRQQAVKGFKKYLVFYRPTDLGVEIIRVIDGARDLEAIFEEE